MFKHANRLPLFGAALLMLSFFAPPVAAQGNGKRYAVSNDKAVAVTRKVLVRREAGRVIFVETPSAILVDIDLKLQALENSLLREHRRDE